MRLEDLQAAVGAWHLRTWGDPGQVTMAAKLAEEVGEVCQAAVKTAQGHPKAGSLDFGGELADVVIVAVAAAALSGVDLTAAIAAKFATLDPDAADRLAA